MNNSTASSESTLRIFSSLFLLLAAIDIVQIVIKLMEKSIDINLMADTYYLTANVMNSNLLDFYIGIPTEDGFLFLFDVPKSGNYFEFGQLVPYNYYNKDHGDRVKAYLATIMSTDPPEEIIAGYENDTYTATACSPIYNSAGEPVAVVAVDLLMPNFKTEIQSALTNVILAILLLVTLCAIAFFIFERKLVILPIQRLNTASRSMVDNLEKDVPLSINIKTGNEIEELSDSFTQMYDEVRDYIGRLNTRA